MIHRAPPGASGPRSGLETTRPSEFVLAGAPGPSAASVSWSSLLPVLFAGGTAGWRPKSAAAAAGVVLAVLLLSSAICAAEARQLKLAAGAAAAPSPLDMVGGLPWIGLALATGIV